MVRRPDSEDALGRCGRYCLRHRGVPWVDIDFWGPAAGWTIPPQGPGDRGLTGFASSSTTVTHLAVGR